MRKKSHISLAKYIVKNVGDQELIKHRKAFYLGSILPDCKPSFLTMKHEFDTTFEMITNDIINISNCEINNERVFCRNLGEIIHFLADYFTLPHNSIFEGNLKDHCIYEKKLKFSLKEYIHKKDFVVNIEKTKYIKTPEALCEFINEAHSEYLKMKKGIEEDCRYIVMLCQQVVQWVVDFVMRTAVSCNVYI